MKQALIILRGTPGSGKTTLSKQLRDSENKIAWLSVDNVKPAFSDFEDRDIDISYRTTVEVLKFLMEEGYSVVLDGIFVRPEQLGYLNQAIECAKASNASVKIYQLVCSLDTLLIRHQNRGWVKSKDIEAEKKEVERMQEKVAHNPISGSIELNTEENTIEKCLSIIKNNLVPEVTPVT